MFLGLEIGGTKLQAGICDRHGRLKAMVHRHVVRAEGRAGILSQLQEIVPGLLEGRRDLEGIGVGFGGPVDRERGVVLRSHQIRGWTKFPLRRWVENEFGFPAFLENDQDCAGLAEAVCGAGRGKRTVLYVHVGTGIGGGLILNGEIYSGRFGAMEIGHTRFCDPYAFSSAPEQSRPDRAEFPTLESLGSGLTLEEGKISVGQAARYVGVGIANAIALLNPEIVIVGGGVTLAGQEFYRPLQQTIRSLVFQPFRSNFKIVSPALGQSVVVIGAGLVAAKRARGRQRS